MKSRYLRCFKYLILSFFFLGTFSFLSRAIAVYNVGRAMPNSLATYAIFFPGLSLKNALALLIHAFRGLEKVVILDTRAGSIAIACNRAESIAIVCNQAKSITITLIATGDTKSDRTQGARVLTVILHINNLC